MFTASVVVTQRHDSSQGIAIVLSAVVIGSCQHYSIRINYQGGETGGSGLQLRRRLLTPKFVKENKLKTKITTYLSIFISILPSRGHCLRLWHVPRSAAVAVVLLVNLQCALRCEYARFYAWVRYDMLC